MTFLGHIVSVEQTAPPTPSAGSVVLYVLADGHLYAKDDTGTERRLS